MEVWFIAWDMNDEDGSLTGKVILSVPDWCHNDRFHWNDRWWTAIGAIKSEQQGRDWLVCEP